MYTALRARSVTHSKMAFVSKQVSAEQVNSTHDISSKGAILKNRSFLTEDRKKSKTNSRTIA